jgi:hypothetical protein
MIEKDRISLIESLDGEWLKLPLVIMRDVGPAVQTLASLLKVTNRETFVAVSRIASKARLPIGTVRKHLARLAAGGWIEQCGRQRTQWGNLRRTATIRVTEQTIQHLTPYGILPWWACCVIKEKGRLPWCVKAVLSLVMARLCGLKKAAEEPENFHSDDDVSEVITDIMGAEDRFRLSLNWLTEQTGLSRDSVVAAKRMLYRRFGIVKWSRISTRRGSTVEADFLIPRWDFQVVVTAAPRGGCYIAFDCGKSG